MAGLTPPRLGAGGQLVASGVLAMALAAALTGRWEPVGVVGGIGSLGLAAHVIGRGRVAAGLAAALVGGWLVVRGTLDRAHGGWRGVAGVAAAVAVAAGIGAAGRAGVATRVQLAALAVTSGGIWVCVPETDAAGRCALVVGVAAGTAAVANVDVERSLIGAAAGLLLFAGLFGGQFRASAVVGALGSFGVLAVAWVPVVVRRPSLRRPRPGLVRDGSLVAVHGVGVLLASRVAGRGASVARAALIMAVVGAAVAVGVVLLRTRETA